MSAPVNGWTGRVKWVGTKRNPKEKAYLRTDDGTELLAVLDSGADDVVADRIAACLNACAGIASPAALGDLVKAAEWVQACLSDAYEAEHADLRAHVSLACEQLGEKLASLRNQQPGEAL